jgi:ketosteroid isomerase-like protein
MAASDADVELVLRAFKEFEVGRTDIAEYYARFWHPDAVIESVDGFPVPGRYEGLEGYRQWFADSYAPYEDVQRRLDSIEPTGGSVLALLTITGRPKDDDVELEVQTGSVYEVEDGRIRRLSVYVGHERALDAVRARG